MQVYRGKTKSRLAVSMPPRHKLADSTPVLTANRGWTTHGDLKVGDYVMYSDKTCHRITNISYEHQINTVYNFSVLDNHNYYVGYDMILVHNAKINTQMTK